MAIADSGLPPGTSVEASIAVSGDFRLQSGGNRVTVINSIVDELTDSGFSTGLKEAGKVTIIRHTGETAAETDGPFHLHIDENNVDSFMGAELKLAFDGIPAGATIALDAWAYTKLNAEGNPNSANLDDRVMFSAQVGQDGDADWSRGSLGVGQRRGHDDALSSVTAADNDTIVSMRLVDEDGNDVTFDDRRY